MKKKYAPLKKIFDVPSHLTVREKIKLFEISSNTSFICEIGSYLGASACCFGESLKSKGFGKVICIDTWNNDTMTEGSRDTWEEFHKNTHDYKNFVFPIRGFSTDVIQSVREITSNLNLLFIDGDHSYEGVKADWEAFKSFLEPGSIVIFHDYGWAEGVKRVVHENVMPMVKNYNRLPNMWWGTISIKP